MILLECTENICKDSCFNVYVVMQILIAAFFAILFIQSGLDKIDDRKGNLEWMKTHFSKSPLKNSIPLFLTLLMLIEIATGILNLSAIIAFFFKDCGLWFFWANVSASLSLLSLFLGQRIAKDYVGAQSITGYFIISLIGIWLSA